MAERKTRKKYSKQYKLDVIQRSFQCDNIRELASDLGLNPGVIYKWRADYEASKASKKPLFTGNGVASLTPEQTEIARLKRELADAKLERDILIKAIAVFGKNDG